MTHEERRYFWGKEVLSAIGVDHRQNGAEAHDLGNSALPGYSSSMYLLKQDTK